MSSKIFDTVIVGAGVSGLSCAIELKIENIENILLIEKSDNGIFEVHTKLDIYKAKNVVIAIGKMGKPNKPNYKIPSEIQKNINFNLDSCSKNEKILVVGG